MIETVSVLIPRVPDFWHLPYMGMEKSCFAKFGLMELRGTPVKCAIAVNCIVHSQRPLQRTQAIYFDTKTKENTQPHQSGPDKCFPGDQYAALL
jgi:hypothetical protein